MVEPSKEQLEQIKQIELEILKAFIGVCEKLSLRYYLVGGTLLGAVRHQGFIPWDDDIDVSMPRADYEIFVREAQKYLPDYYFVQTIDTDPDYILNFAKIRDSRTTFVEYNLKEYAINHGVYIDVFPQDFYPEKKLDRIAMKLKQLFFKYRLRGAVEVAAVAQHSPVVELGIRAVSGVTMLMSPNLKQVVRKREQIYRSVPEGTLWANYCGAWGSKEVIPRQWYADGVELCFEGITAIGPAQYDKWLTQVYGDYMQLPPVEKRVGHHYAEAIALDQPYTHYNKTIQKNR